jgi:hypothetical protein
MAEGMFMAFLFRLCLRRNDELEYLFRYTFFFRPFFDTFIKFTPCHSPSPHQLPLDDLDSNW